MAIVNGDLSLKRSENESDVAASNGGYLASNLSNIPSSLFPNISGAESAAGKTRYRKVFFHNAESAGLTAITKYADLALELPMVYMENISPAGDNFTLHAGTASDVQSAAEGYTGWAGVGYLETDIALGATTLQVRCEQNGTAGELFQDGGLVVLSRFHAGVLTRAFVPLSTPGTSWAGAPNQNLCTLTFTNNPTVSGWVRAFDTRTADAGNVGDLFVGHANATYVINELVGKRERIKNGAGAGQVRRVVSNTVTRIYVESSWTTALVGGSSEYEVLDTMVSMCVPLSSLLASYSNVAVTSASGTLTHTGNLKVYPAGTLDETWTVLFSSATNFTVTGTHYTNLVLPAGTINADYIPANGSSYHFKIPLTAWGGTFQAGDTVVFQTHSGGQGVWIKEVVPAGSAVHKANSIDLATFGDTV